MRPSLVEMGMLGSFAAYFLSSIFILVPVTLFLFYAYCRYKLNYWRRRGVPQFDDPHLIFGDLKEGLLMRSPPGAYLGQLYHRAPSDVPYFGFYIFHKPCLMIKDPELIKHIMVRDFDNFTDRYFGGSAQRDSPGMLNLFGIRNPTWKYMIKKVSPTFSLSKLKQTLPLMLEPCSAMMRYLETRSASSAALLDAQDINYKLTADLFANIALGTKTDSFNNPDPEYIENMMRYFHSMKRMVALVILTFVPQLVSVFGEQVFFGYAFLQKMFWSALKRREEAGEKRGDYLDTLITLKNGEQDSLYKFEGDNLVAQAGTFMALESSSYAAGFTLLELARHAAWQRRVRGEVQRAVARRGWTMEAFSEMKLLDMCLAEALRMYPPINIIDRQALRDYKIPNSVHVIERGTPVHIPLYGFHYDPRFFKNPKTFDPDRFAAGNTIPAAYMPYGVGHRKCIAMKYGQLHVKVVVAQMLSQFEVRRPLADQSDHSALDPRSPFSRAVDGVNLHFIKLYQKIE